jgi:hypothetical protein
MIERIRMASILKETKKHISNEKKEKEALAASEQPDSTQKNDKKAKRAKKVFMNSDETNETNKKSEMNEQHQENDQSSLSKSKSPSCLTTIEIQSGSESNAEIDVENITRLNRKRKKSLLSKEILYRPVSPSRTLPKNIPAKNISNQIHRPQTTAISKIVDSKEQSENGASVNSSPNKSYFITTLDSNGNESTTSPKSPMEKSFSSDILIINQKHSSPHVEKSKKSNVHSTPIAKSSKKDSINSAPNIHSNQVFHVADLPNFFLGTQMGNAIQFCANQLSSKSTSSQNNFVGNQPFAFQPKVVTFNPQTQSNQMIQQQSPLILPTNFNGTILYQPTIYLNTNKKLSDLINLQKSYRHIVPKSPGMSPNISPSLTNKNTQNSKLAKKTPAKN